MTLVYIYISGFIVAYYLRKYLKKDDLGNFNRVTLQYEKIPWDWNQVKRGLNYSIFSWITVIIIIGLIIHDYIVDYLEKYINMFGKWIYKQTQKIKSNLPSEPPKWL